MEEKSTLQKLTLKDFDGIEFDPNGFKIDYLTAIAKRALDILDRENHMKKKDKAKRKYSDSDQGDEQYWNKKDGGKREPCHLNHLDEQPRKKKKLEEKNRKTLDLPRFSGGVCIKGFSRRVINREKQQYDLSKRMCMKECSETMIKRSDQRRRNEVSLQSRKEVLRREKQLKRPMVKDQTACDHEFQEPKKSKNIKKLDIDHALDFCPDLPREFMETLQKFAEGKSVEEPQLVLQKGLFDTDISKTHNRLSIPSSHLLCEFLTQDEIADLELRIGKNVKKIEVDIIEPSLQKNKVSLRRWDMKKGKEKPSSIIYVFSGTWNKLVSRNSLKPGQVVQIWSARVDGKLWFLLVRVPMGGEKNLILTAGPSSSSLEPNQDHCGHD